MKMNFVYVSTTDDLRLMGVHYTPAKKDTAVLFIHGMAGNIMEYYFADVLGKKLAEEGKGFVFSHNRGYNHINDIDTTQMEEKGGYKKVRFGVVYEIFEDCLLDIDAWIEETRTLGYKKIILMGHSLGCNKVIYYLSQRKLQDVVGVVLASPADMVGQIKPEYQPDREEMIQEAQEYMKQGEPRKLLTRKLWDWYNLSAQTFLSLFMPGTNADNLPVLKNPKVWPQLSSIKQPLLAFMGEYDDIAIRKLEDDLSLIKEKATGAASFTEAMIPKASHTYDGQEDGVAEVVTKWVKTLK